MAKENRNFVKDIDSARLCKVVKDSYSQKKIYRSNRYKFIQESVGIHYSRNGSQHPVPVNFIRLAQTIFTRKLISSNPQFNISTNIDALKNFSLDFKTAINHLVEEMDLQLELKKLITAAMFSPMGVMKTGLGKGNVYEIYGEKIDIGQPFSMLVDFDNFVIDMTATSAQAVQFIGDIQRIDYDYAMDTYKGKGREQLQYKELDERNKDNLYNNSYKVSNIGRNTANTYYSGVSEFKKTTDVVDIYLPYEQLIVTYPWNYDDQVVQPLEIQDYYGPEGGPYDLLSFNDVDGNLLGASPASFWYDLHELANVLYRKLSRQAKRQKDILAVDPAAKEDAERIQRSNDGQVTTVERPDKIREVTYGGINQPNFAFFLNNKDLFNHFQGNLDILGGLGPQSETLGQDQLLMGSSSQQINEMKDRVESCVTSIGKKLAWYLFHDPFIQMPLVKRYEGISVGIPIIFSEETKEGDFLDYNFTIKAYSMNQKTPLETFNTMLMFYERVILPSQQLMSQQGLVIDFESFMRTCGELLDLDEIDDMIALMTDQRTGLVRNETPISTPAPAKTSREYIRKNVSGMTNKGTETNLMQMMMSSANPNMKMGGQ